MKGFIFIAIGFLLLDTTKSGDTCKVLLMESYNLTGRRAPLKDQNPLCHTITDNCCTTDDVIKMYNEATGVVEPALQSYREKMQRAISDLVAFNGMIQKIKYSGSTAPEQTEFCQKAEDDFKKINFEVIADSLKSGFDKAYSESKDYHMAFYCALCDYKAHKVIDTSKKTITLSPATCMARIVNNKAYVTALNVDLINYFMAAQKFLDCTTYDSYYNFPFLFKDEGESAAKAKKCLVKVSNDPKFMPPDCAEFCGSLNFAGISSNLEGDAIFLDKITDYYRGMIIARNRAVAMMGSTYQPFVELDKFQVELKDSKQRKLSKVMLFPGRALAEASKDKKKKSGEPGEGATVEDLVAYYEEVYNEIVFETNPQSTELLKVQVDPYNLQTFKIDYSADDKALDIPAYFTGLNFDVSKTELTKLTIVEKKKKVVIDPHIEALCMIADVNEIKLITDDIKLAALFVVPPEFISETEKTLQNAKVIDKEADEMIDTEEAEEKKKAEQAAAAAATTTASAAAPATKKARRRMLRKSGHRHHNRRHNKHRKANKRHHGKNHRFHRRRSNNAHKLSNRRRKLESLMNFD